MLRRYTRLVRRTPLKRGGYIRRISPKLRTAKACYDLLKQAWLREHPFCQIMIARTGLDEQEVIAAAGGLPVTRQGEFRFKGYVIPTATQIHHRNKRNGRRLTDTRWFMSACDEEHDLVENNKDWARKEGFLLDISANPDGMTPGGLQAVETPVLMRLKVR